MRVVVASDDSATAANLCRTLVRESCRIDACAVSLDSVVERAAQHRPDALILWLQDHIGSIDSANSRGVPVVLDSACTCVSSSLLELTRSVNRQPEG